ncbi:MAG: ABC transporter permease [Candidatus Tectomicrobia bacterium]|nr:ABC transporter permease [Candidatus Tectomicrobia bacterium]
MDFKHHLRGETKFTGLLVILFFFALWEFLSRQGIIYTAYFPPVTTIVEAFVRETFLGDRELVTHVGFTLYRAFAGYLFGILIGTSLGTVTGIWRSLYQTLEPTIEILRPMPSVAIIPIAILFMGMGSRLNIFIIAWAATWPIFVNTLDGVRGVDLTLVNTARTFQLPRRAIIRKVMIPSALPYIISGYRISLGTALVVVVVTEMVVSGSGLGFYIMNTSQSFRIPEMFAGMLMIAIVGYLLNTLFVRLDNHFMAWHKRLTKKEAV